MTTGDLVVSPESTGRPAGLVARSTRVEDPVAVRAGLLAAAGVDGIFWHQADHAFATAGTALTLELTGGLADAAGVASVAEVLATVRAEDEVGGPGTGALAAGALPFRPEGTGRLVVPQALVGVRGDDVWVTTVSGEDGSEEADAAAARLLAAATAGGPTAPAPDAFELVSQRSHEAWKAMVGHAVETIGGGDLRKVVLARRIDVSANRPFVTADILSRLLALYPTCTVFRVDGFLGASPELLIDRRGREVRSHPLAGTVARSGDVASDLALVEGIMASAKNRSEHALVLEGLRAALGPVCDRLDIADVPSILELRNVSHLATEVQGHLAPGTSHRGRLEGPTALELVARVHPTPAVGGTPTAGALAWIRAEEGFDRGRYAGPVGWVDARGDGTWAIAIRSAVVEGATASMFAGNGIVAASDPADELAETQLKLQALLAALVRP